MDPGELDGFGCVFEKKVESGFKIPIKAFFTFNDYGPKLYLFNLTFDGMYFALKFDGGGHSVHPLSIC